MSNVDSTSRNKVIYSCKNCIFCGFSFQPKSSKQKTCNWKCRFFLLQSSFLESNECWKWPQSFNPQTGYGQFHTEGESKRNQSAHRLSYFLNNGEIADGLCVMHSCDNRWCFNPAHLSLGTQSDNLDDMRKKGRANYSVRRRLESHPNAKLTIDAVAYIRSSTDTEMALASRFGVSKSAIHMARNGISWKSAPLAQQSF